MADNCLYAIVQQATITEVTAKTVSFSTRSSTKDSEVFTVPMTEILADPPAQAPQPVALTAGATGNLYLSKDGWKVTASSGSTIYEAGNANIVLFKWPKCFPYRMIGELSVNPT